MGVIRKENIAAAAFRRYARLGLDTPMAVEVCMDRIRGLAVSRTDRVQLLAVWETLHLLEAFDATDALAAVRAIWMEEGQSVAAFSLDAGWSERATFRMLAEIRACFDRLVRAFEKA